MQLPKSCPGPLRTHRQLGVAHQNSPTIKTSPWTAQLWRVSEGLGPIVGDILRALTKRAQGASRTQKHKNLCFCAFLITEGTPTRARKNTKKNTERAARSTIHPRAGAIRAKKQKLHKNTRFFIPNNPMKAPIIGVSPYECARKGSHSPNSQWNIHRLRPAFGHKMRASKDAAT